MAETKTKVSARSFSRSFIVHQPPGVKPEPTWERRYWNDSVTYDLNPNWRQLILEKKNATTKLDGTGKTYEMTNGSTTFRESGVSGTYTDTSGGFQLSQVEAKLVSTGLVALAKVAEAKCLSKYYGLINDLSSPLKGQAMVGEFGQTLRLLKAPWKSGLKLLQNLLLKRNSLMFSGVKGGLKSGQVWPKTKQTIACVGDLWLEARFGFIPLMQDIEDILAIAKKTAIMEEVNSYRCFGAAEDATTAIVEFSKLYGLQHVHRIVVKQKVEHIIRFGYLTKLTDSVSEQGRIASDSFLSLRDLPGTAWELTPWSFLVDYFVNVGSIIEAITESTANVVWTSQSVVKTASVEFSEERIRFIAPRYSLMSHKPTRCRVTNRSVARTAGPPGIPSVVFSLPHSNVRLANIAALLAGMLNPSSISHNLKG